MTLYLSQSMLLMLAYKISWIFVSVLDCPFCHSIRCLKLSCPLFKATGVHHQLARYLLFLMPLTTLSAPVGQHPCNSTLMLLSWSLHYSHFLPKQIPVSFKNVQRQIYHNSLNFSHALPHQNPPPLYPFLEWDMRYHTQLSHCQNTPIYLPKSYYQRVMTILGSQLWLGPTVTKRYCWQESQTLQTESTVSAVLTQHYQCHCSPGSGRWMFWGNAHQPFQQIFSWSLGYWHCQWI